MHRNYKLLIDFIFNIFKKKKNISKFKYTNNA